MNQVGGYQISEVATAFLQIIFFVSIFSLGNLKMDYKYNILNESITRGDVLVVSLAIVIPLLYIHNRFKIEKEQQLI